MAELLTDNHMERLEELFDEVNESINIISPFLNVQMVDYLCEKVKENNIRCTVVTRTYLQDFIDNVNSVYAIEKLLNHDIEVYSANGLHTKLYIFDDKKAIVGSANFTLGGFNKNIELSLLVDEKKTVKKLKDYNNAIIEECDYDDNGRVSIELIEKMNKDYQKGLSKKTKSGNIYQTKMYGADIGLSENNDNEQVSEDKSEKETDIVQRFFEKKKNKEVEKQSYKTWIKFVGESKERIDNESIEILPDVLLEGKKLFVINSKKGMNFTEGDRVYIAPLSDIGGKNQPIIVGRGILRTFNKNEVQTEWSKKYYWMREYKYYCVVEKADMLNSPIKNGIPLLSVINELGPETYESTRGTHKTFEEMARVHYRRPHLQLTNEAQSLIDEWFDELSKKHGVIQLKSE